MVDTFGTGLMGHDFLVDGLLEGWYLESCQEQRQRPAMLSWFETGWLIGSLAITIMLIPRLARCNYTSTRFLHAFTLSKKKTFSQAVIG